MKRLSVRIASRRSDGFILVTVGVFLTALILLAGFAVDLGAWYLQANKLQRATDSAALAGAVSLPDQAAASAQAKRSLEHNGMRDGENGLSVQTETRGSHFVVTISNNRVNTYFLKMVKPSITISRTSEAGKGSRTPALGSPYNVLGTGSLSISNIPKQNFWLAINGSCAPKEDGDYFNAMYDGNKSPFTSNFEADGHNFVPASTGKHYCPTSNEVGAKNQAYSKTGYSYYVDVPPAVKGPVTIKAYDAAYNSKVSNSIDFRSAMPNDYEAGMMLSFLVFDTHKTPDDVTDDGNPVAAKFIDVSDSRDGVSGDWLDLYTVSHANIVAGRQYRVQVMTEADDEANHSDSGTFYGVNAFSIGAFVNGVVSGCDTRTDPMTCPRTYGGTAMSIYNNLQDSTNGTSSFYFADVDETFVGLGMSLYLWDPGEGVTKLEVIGPDETPMKFDWTSDPPAAGYSGAQQTSIDTSGPGPQPQPNLSNDYKFNDRLLTIHLTIPSEYRNMVQNAGGKTGISIRYTVGDSPNDRTTWGLSMDDGGSSPVHLIRRS